MSEVERRVEPACRSPLHSVRPVSEASHGAKASFVFGPWGFGPIAKCPQALVFIDTIEMTPRDNPRSKGEWRAGTSIVQSTADERRPGLLERAMEA